jgi:hypothetical protein
MITTTPRIIRVLALASVLSLAATVAGDYDVPWYTIDGGGEMFSTGGQYALSGSIGQADAGAMTGGSFSLTGGFWAAPPEAPCPGDLNGDGFRNVSDFTLFAAAYGSHSGDPNYNPAADLNGDGFVNVSDFTVFATNYGVPCP